MVSFRLKAFFKKYFSYLLVFDVNIFSLIKKKKKKLILENSLILKFSKHFLSLSFSFLNRSPSKVVTSYYLFLPSLIFQISKMS
jgi:hypothetical protein